MEASLGAHAAPWGRGPRGITVSLPGSSLGRDWSLGKGAAHQLTSSVQGKATKCCSAQIITEISGAGLADDTACPQLIYVCRQCFGCWNRIQPQTPELPRAQSESAGHVEQLLTLKTSSGAYKSQKQLEYFLPLMISCS